MAVPVRRDNVAKNNARVPSFLGQVWQQITHFLEMPPTESPTLPEVLLARTGINSWVLASLSVGILFYLLFLIIASLDGFAQATLNNSGSVWLSLLPPITLIYLLLVIPVLHRRLNRSVEVFRSMVPLNDRFTRLENEAYALNRRREWIAVGVGTLIGWVLLRPVWDPSHLSALIYDFIGDILIFGLTGWHIYAALSRTKLLVKMHGQVQNLNIFKDRAPFTPISRWTLTVTGVMIVGVIIMALLIPPENLLHPSVVIIAGAVVLSTILVLSFSKVPTSMLGQFRVLRALIFFMIVAIIGTIGFNQLEKWTMIEAFYATIITMTTIGYGDLVPTTEGGRIFTVVLSLFAIGIGGYAITSVASFVIEGNFHRFIQGRKVDKQIVQMSQHYILCGVGKVGKQIAIEFYKTQIPFVVIEQNSDVLDELLHEIEIPYVQGDATQDASLRLAGIERAKGLVTTLRDDKDNVFVALSARSFKRDLRIISRVSHDKNRKKLEKAGATDIISPNAVSGRRMVSEMLHSEVVTFLDEMLRAEHQIGQTLRLEELHINAIRVPALVERLEQGELSITDIGQRTDLMVVAIKREQPNGGDPYIYTPRGNTRLQRNDVLIVIATPEQRVKLYHNVLAHKTGWLSQLWN